MFHGLFTNQSRVLRQMEKQMEVISAKHSQAAIISWAYVSSDMLQLPCHNETSFIQFQDHLVASDCFDAAECNWFGFEIPVISL